MRLTGRLRKRERTMVPSKTENRLRRQSETL
jgi:hypothetical protein